MSDLFHYMFGIFKKTKPPEKVSSYTQRDHVYDVTLKDGSVRRVNCSEVKVKDGHLVCILHYTVCCIYKPEDWKFVNCMVAVTEVKISGTSVDRKIIAEYPLV